MSLIIEGLTNVTITEATGLIGVLVLVINCAVTTLAAVLALINARHVQHVTRAVAEVTKIVNGQDAREAERNGTT